MDIRDKFEEIWEKICEFFIELRDRIRELIDRNTEKKINNRDFLAFRNMDTEERDNIMDILKEIKQELQPAHIHSYNLKDLATKLYNESSSSYKGPIPPVTEKISYKLISADIDIRQGRLREMYENDITQFGWIHKTIDKHNKYLNRDKFFYNYHSLKHDLTELVKDFNVHQTDDKIKNMSEAVYILSCLLSESSKCQGIWVHYS